MENKEFIAVLRDVRNEVAKATNNEQTPGQYDQLMNEVFLMEGIPNRSDKLAEENEKMAKQIAALAEQRRIAKSEAEKNQLLIEQQRIESEKKLKEIELEQVRKAETRRAEETKRMAEEKAKQNENQRKQEEDIIRMQKENESRQRELEKLLSDSQNVDQLVQSANEIYQTINAISAKYNTARDKAISETKAFYQNKRSQIVRDEVETRKEFETRRVQEEKTLNEQEQADIAKIHSDYENTIKLSTDELNRKLQDCKVKKYLLTGKRIVVTFKSYDAEAQKYPFNIVDVEEPQIHYDGAIDMSGYAIAERRQVYQNVKNTIEAKGYIGYMEYGILWNSDTSFFEKELKRVGIKQLSDDKVVAEIGSKVLKNMVLQQRKQIQEAEKERIRLERERESEMAQQKRKAEQNRIIQQYTNYRNKCIGCGSLLGIGSVFGCGSIVMVVVGVVNLADCINYNFNAGVGISWAILGSGIAMIVSSCIMTPFGSIGLVKANRLYRSSGLCHRKKILLTLQTFDLTGGYNFEKETVSLGMGVKL